MPSVSFTQGEIEALTTACVEREMVLCDAMADEQAVLLAFMEYVESPVTVDDVEAATAELDRLGLEDDALQRAFRKLMRVRKPRA